MTGRRRSPPPIAAGDRTSEAEVLNTLGMTQIVTGRVDDGAALLWRAIEIARQADDLDSAAFAYGNLADALSLAGRTREALEIAREGLAATPARLKGTHEWLMMTVAELSFEVGDWAGSRAHLTPPPSRLSGISLIFRLIREADLALGEGDEDAAARCLTEVEPLVALSSQPQWIGVLGALLGELRRRRRELAGARAAVAEALDRIEVCTDDVARIARVTAVGVNVEADFAPARARPAREARGARRDRPGADPYPAATGRGGGRWAGREGVSRKRSRGAGTGSGPERSSAVAQGRRALGCNRPSVPGRARALARGRGVRRGGRSSGGRRPGASGARGWPPARLPVALGGGHGAGRTGTAASWGATPERAPVAAAEDADPFGLTARERQVLALLAEGATNRQIGAALYMAEKTASVHVSRILGKLGVQSRTQAAAVAHRMHLA